MTQPKSISRERYAFDRAAIQALATLAKGSGWKKKGPWLFRQQDGFLLVGRLQVWVNDLRSVASMEVKPIGLDPLLWDILGFEGNKKEPLSLQVNGAFTTSGLPQCEADIEKAGDTPEQVAASFLAFCDAQAAVVLAGLRRTPFLEQVRNHPNQVERGAYAITLVVALITEGHRAEARALAEDYAAERRRSTFGIISSGRSFHHHALDWLAAGGGRPTAS